MEYDNELRGTLFKNERKESDTHSDYNGKVTVNGVEYYLNAWINEKKGGGGKYMSLRLKPKDVAATPVTRVWPPSSDAPADEMPF